ncbi:YqaA family protein [Microvirga sp. W0021]|uniref:YqaA family protein n=1 Tax=Hohaiivirga grylli TaxID=3133970 RepID=A0ABV0BNA8_9HYPH
MFRSLYNWILSLAARPSAPWALSAVSFAESSFFPIPPDVMLVPMVLAKPERAWFYAFICTVASVLGGIVGYFIGAVLYDTIGVWLFNLYGLTEQAAVFRDTYGEYGAYAILIKGFTPIPFKLITITSGFANYPLFWFVILSALTRGARFFLVVALVKKFGPEIQHILDRHINIVGIIFIVVLIGGFVVFRYLL